IQASNDTPAFRLSAAEAELKADLSRSVMILTMTDCEVEIAPSIRSFIPGREIREFPLTFFSAKDVREGNPTNLPLRQITSEIPAQQRLIEELERSLAAQSAIALVTGELQDLSEAIWRGRRKQLSDARTRLVRLRTESPRRW